MNPVDFGDLASPLRIVMRRTFLAQQLLDVFGPDIAVSLYCSNFVYANLNYPALSLDRHFLSSTLVYDQIPEILMNIYSPQHLCENGSRAICRVQTCEYVSMLIN